MNKKVSFVITDMSAGGAERVMSLIANYFCEKDLDVQILAIRSDKVTYPIDSKINFKFIGSKKNKIANFFWRIFKLRKELKNSDVVISFLWHCNVYALISTMFTKKLKIISERSNPNDELLGVFKYFKWFRNLCYHMADIIVFQTDGAMSCYKGSLYKKGVVIPNPITPNLPVADKKRKNKIVAVGRLTTQKNYPMMLEAYKIFSEKHPEYKLFIYGDGGEKEKLKKWIKDNKIDDKIILEGFKNNVINEILDAKLLLNSSDFEGISNSLLEALAVGIPVVATDCPAGGTRQYVKSGFNGELVEMRNVEAFTEAIFRIIDDEDYQKKISKNATKIREELSIESVGNKWMELVCKK